MADREGDLTENNQRLEAIFHCLDPVEEPVRTGILLFHEVLDREDKEKWQLENGNILGWPALARLADTSKHLFKRAVEAAQEAFTNCVRETLLQESL